VEPPPLRLDDAGTLSVPAPAAHARYLATARFSSLDGLRFVSIVPVVWHHATLGPLPGALGRGPLGVDLFFVLSGFLITTLLLRERDASGHIDARAFYVRRSLRIFPLYYVVLGLYAVHAALLPHDAPQRAHFFRSLVFFATYTTNWFVDFAVPHPVSFAFAWSLAAEEQFYLLWPWVVRGWRGSRARWAAPLLVSLCLLLVDQAVEHHLLLGLLPPGGLPRRVVASIASPICMGALLAQALHAPRGFALLRPVLGVRASAPLAFAALVASACLDGVPLWLAQALMALVVGACAVRPDHGLAPLLDLAPLRWVGSVSYGVYLFHVAVITFVRRALPSLAASPAWTFAVAFPLAVALGSLSFVLFERPVMALRARLVRSVRTA
jgi:peptidoglycan/LPS O-acetylase OafA/YrhL